MLRRPSRLRSSTATPLGSLPPWEHRVPASVSSPKPLQQSDDSECGPRRDWCALPPKSSLKKCGKCYCVSMTRAGTSRRLVARTNHAGREPRAVGTHSPSTAGSRQKPRAAVTPQRTAKVSSNTAHSRGLQERRSWSRWCDLWARGQVAPRAGAKVCPGELWRGPRLPAEHEPRPRCGALGNSLRAVVSSS